MHRLRRYLVPLLLMLPVIFVCGKLLLTPVNIQKVYGDPTGDLIPDLKQYDRGWPWFFVHEFKSLPPAVDAGRTSRNWFSIGSLLKDIAVLIAIAAATWLAIGYFYSRSRGTLRFSLRALFVFVTLAGIACGWWMYQDRRFHHEQKLLKAFEAKYGPLNEVRRYRGPDWLRRFVSDDRDSIFKRVIRLELDVKLDDGNSGELPEDLKIGLPEFGHLQNITFSSKSANPFGEDHPHLRLTGLAPMPQLEELVFADYTADDETLIVLPQVPNLRTLWIFRGAITQRGITKTGDCASLENLTIQRVMTKPLTHLPALRQLTELSLEDFELLESAFEDLLQMKSLQTLELSNPKLSEKSLRRLVELPELSNFFWKSDEEISPDTLEFLEKQMYVQEY